MSRLVAVALSLVLCLISVSGSFGGSIPWMDAPDDGFTRFLENPIGGRLNAAMLVPTTNLGTGDVAIIGVNTQDTGNPQRDFISGASMPRSRTRVVISSPGHRLTRASNVSPSSTRNTSAGCVAVGSVVRALVVAGDGKIGGSAGGAAALRVTVTGAMAVPTPRPRVKVNAASSAIGWPCLWDNNLGWRNIVLDIAESHRPRNLNQKAYIHGILAIGCNQHRPQKSDARPFFSQSP